MNKTSVSLVVLLLLGLVAVIWLGQVRDEVEQMQSVTVYSRHNKSLSLFREWKAGATGQSVSVNKKAFLFPDELAGFDGVMIASPRRAIAAREAEILADYVRQGGRLILSAHDHETYDQLDWLLFELDLPRPGEIEVHANYQSRQVRTVVPEDNQVGFDRERAYGFYSLIQFSPAGCEGRELACFVQWREIEAGQVLLVLGLPLMGNAMVERLSNMDFTLFVGRWAPHLLIDEYHHFFTQKTWSDLLARIDFTVPLVGMVVGLVLFFGFAHSRFHERVLNLAASRTYHELNENVVRKFLRNPALTADALDQQRQFMLRLFPTQAEAVNTLYARFSQQVSRNPKVFPQALGEFVRFHQDQLKRRGRRETS